MESYKHTQFLRAFLGDGIRHASNVHSPVIFKHGFKLKHTQDLGPFGTGPVAFPIGQCPNLYTFCRLLVMVFILMQLCKHIAFQSDRTQSHLLAVILLSH